MGERCCMDARRLSYGLTSRLPVRAGIRETAPDVASHGTTRRGASSPPIRVDRWAERGDTIDT